MKRRTSMVILISAMAIACLPGAIAEACTCAGPLTLTEARASAHTAFRGRVLSMQWIPRSPGADAASDTVDLSSVNKMRYILVADAIWKGVVTETLVVSSDWSTASCGFLMEVGAESLLFARPTDRFLGGVPRDSFFEVSYCEGSRPLSEAAKHLATLGTPIWTKRAEQQSK